MHLRDGGRQSGQGTVEYVGLVLVIALALAAAGVWAVSHVRAPAGPPLELERARDASLERLVTPPAGWVAPFEGRGRGLGAPLRRGLGAARRAAARAVGVVVDGAVAFGGGFASGLWSDARATVGASGRGDPLGALRDPIGTVRRRLAAARSYVRELRSLPPGAAYRQVMRDLGELAADVAVLRARQLALRRLSRRLEDARLPGP